eukprot:75382-Amphidinium_carterae.1
MKKGQTLRHHCPSNRQCLNFGRIIKRLSHGSFENSLRRTETNNHSWKRSYENITLPKLKSRHTAHSFTSKKQVFHGGHSSAADSLSLETVPSIWWVTSHARPWNALQTTRINTPAMLLVPLEGEWRQSIA